VFDVEDVLGFCEKSARNGLVFSAEHPADGYSYANAKDPCGNNIQVSRARSDQAATYPAAVR
jgi:hypothetical protein